MYVRHQRSPLGHHTACGHLWQGWQMHVDGPEAIEYLDGQMGTLPGPDLPPGGDDVVIDCETCAAELQRWEDEAPLREEAARPRVDVAGRAEAAARAQEM